MSCRSCPSLAQLWVSPGRHVTFPLKPHVNQHLLTFRHCYSLKHFRPSIYKPSKMLSAARIASKSLLENSRQFSSLTLKSGYNPMLATALAQKYDVRLKSDGEPLVIIQSRSPNSSCYCQV